MSYKIVNPPIVALVGSVVGFYFGSAEYHPWAAMRLPEPMPACSCSLTEGAYAFEMAW
jgi:hypothetical protein